MSAQQSWARDPRLVDSTTRLVEFLRDLATARRVPVRDLRNHGQVLWLADLPDMVEPHRDAGLGEVLFSVDHVRSAPHPAPPDELHGWLRQDELIDPELNAPELSETGLRRIEETDEDGSPVSRWETQEDRPDVVEAYGKWLPHWRTWADQERERVRQQRWHRDLYSISNQFGQIDDEWELVLATGLLSWTAPDGTRVRNHLLSTRLHLRVDQDTERVDVLLGETAAKLQDRELLADLDGFSPQRTDRLRLRAREGEGVGLQASVTDLLESWCDRGLESDPQPRYRPDWASGDASAQLAEVRLAPALVLRKRDHGSLISYYDEMISTLTGPDAQTPLGLAQLVSPLEPTERMAFLQDGGVASGDTLGQDPLFPLPANPEQRTIMTRLRSDNGVVVQGPPGTGKTHSIANLLSSLLAQGQRVLVTSQKAQALRVLRDKLPVEIANLCVSMTDLGRGGSAELEGGVKALSNRFSSFDATRQAKSIAEKRHQLDSARRTTVELTERIRALRESETYRHPEIAANYSGTLADVVRRLTREEPECSWMPVPLPASASPLPPITVGEAADLIALLAGETSGRKARPSQRIPDVAALPSAEKLKGLIAAEVAAQDMARQAQTDISARLEHLAPHLISRLEVIAADVALRLQQLGMPEEASDWDPADWTVSALADGLGSRETAVWDQLAAHTDRLAAAQDAIRSVGFRKIDYPPMDSPGTTGAYLQSMRALRDYFAAGNQLKRGLFKSAVQKQAEPWLAGTLVDGIVPSNAELLSLVIAELEGRATVGELLRGWQLVGVAFPRDLPLQRTVAQLGDAFNRLDQVRQITSAVTETARLLTTAGVHIWLRTPAEWLSYVTALRAVQLQAEAERATSALNDLHTTLQHEARLGTPAPELLEAGRSVAARDGITYQLCLTALVDAQREQVEQQRCEELSGRVRSAHPALLGLLREAQTWQLRFSTWDRAWAWARAQTFFVEQRRPGLEQRLEAELEAANAREMRLTAELAAEQAWQAALSRMTSHQTTALRAYQDHIGKLGKGTGRYAGRYQSLAREAMVHARDAVPAWIMPLQQVLETIPPIRDSFDVVIVDEASQASIEALFLLWLAPRVIVVGDDKQCAPSVVSHGELEPIFAKLSTYLPDMPPYLRDAFTPKSSLFDLLATRFGSVLRLKEHFRCMPEIIDFSSRQFYADEPLVPLRQFGADRLPPLRVVRVTGAQSEGSATRLRNVVEAEAIVDRILACMEDPAYKDKTFGVVVLQGTGQVQLLHNMLLDRLDPKDWEKRRLRVGTPPDFQGDERDVVFLSMVVAEKRTAVTSTEWQRRFNVAASRAKDQMWLFHSVSPDLLSPVCLRRSLLTYMLNPPATLLADSLSDVTPDDPHPEFDSLFEQRVFLHIRRRGYHVVPQVEVNGRRIDLVVSGAKGRLAVECDGDFWHGTPEQRAEDLDRERELKRAGWRFWRIRESEFYFDPSAAMESLWTELDRRGILPSEIEISAGEENDAPSSWNILALSGSEGWDGLEDGDSNDMSESPIEALSIPRLRNSSVGPTTTQVRAWARTQGYAVGDRGRLPEEIAKAYQHAHSSGQERTNG
ncbi:Lsr2 protein [Streptosporangium subroseum]|uniref:Lsr2 protein n=1 Tax=Streptosporangium subroseum TaxID=106412 RepID=A0A239BKA7_9ACTN|nr:histone-like nucleoid-structuring protein Lsr2 [Streptosporangium subroseum]SNS08575.1 Lsr2 protein [Streptosporangium subroseum]